MRNSEALAKPIVAVLVIAVAVFLFSLASYFLSSMARPPLEPYLELQIFPPGYPEIGDSWSLLVYKTNLTDVTPIHKIAENATVIVDILARTNDVEFYELQTDDSGRTSFWYLPRYSEVCFQAFLNGYRPSNRVILNQSYVPRSTATFLFSFSSGSIVGALGIGKYLMEKKKTRLRRILYWNMPCIIVVSSFILLLTFYSFLFKSTSWGFPSEVIAPFLTFESLKYSAFTVVILYVFTAFLSFMDYSKSKNRKTVKRHSKKSRKKKTTTKRDSE